MYIILLPRCFLSICLKDKSCEVRQKFIFRPSHPSFTQQTVLLSAKNALHPWDDDKTSIASGLCGSYDNPKKITKIKILLCDVNDARK